MCQVKEREKDGHFKSKLKSELHVIFRKYLIKTIAYNLDDTWR